MAITNRSESTSITYITTITAIIITITIIITTIIITTIIINRSAGDLCRAEQ